MHLLQDVWEVDLEPLVDKVEQLQRLCVDADVRPLHHVSSRGLLPCELIERKSRIGGRIIGKQLGCAAVIYPQ